MKNYSRLLQKYAQVMLPPSPGKSIDLPSLLAPKAPDAEAITNEQLKRVEEIERAKEEGAEADRLKQEHIAEMLKHLDEGNFFDLGGDKEVVVSKSASSADKILKLCTNYYKLCSK